MAPALVETVRLTFTFLVSHARTLLRLIWFPVFILALSGVFFTARLLPFLPALQSGNAAEIQGVLMPSLGFISLGLVIPLIMSATAATAVLRFVILGEGSTSRAPLYVATGASVLRVIGVTLILSVILILIAFLIALIVKTLASFVPALSGLLPLFIIVGLAAVAVRWLMAYPIAAVTGRIDFEGAWSLTKPIYTRLLTLVLALAMVISLVDFLIDAALVPVDPRDLPALAKLFKERWILITLASFVSNLFATASFFTLLGIVYRLRMRETERSRPQAIRPISQPDEPAP